MSVDTQKIPIMIHYLFKTKKVGKNRKNAFTSLRSVNSALKAHAILITKHNNKTGTALLSSFSILHFRLKFGSRTVQLAEQLKSYGVHVNTFVNILSISFNRGVCS